MTLLLFGLCLATGVTATAEGPPLPDGTDSGWWSEVQRNITAEEYHVSWQDRSNLPDLDAGWQAPNRAHDLRTHFTESAIRVVRRTETEPSWEWSMSLLRVGRPSALHEVEAPTLHAYENRIEYHRRGEFELVEYYVNDTNGLKQGFTIPRPPEAAENRLLIDIAVGGTLHSVLASDRQSFDFQTVGGQRLIHYGQLRVTDAHGNVLRSWMEGFAEGSVSGIRLVIEDGGASYPLEVDPLATSPAWAVSGDQANAYFGNSLGSAGDVNGDGYGDVVVGAPWYDSLGTNAGKVFVYHGSASGLPVVPSWISAGNYSQPHANMGYSVSTAGDVDGDGYNDLLVGLPGYDSDEGAFRLFYGSESGLDSNQLYVAETVTLTGYSVSTAGDVNGDGYSDVIVGAPAAGIAWVYHGGPGGLTYAWNADTQALSDPDYEFGRSVGLAGDVNGDGYSDVIVGWPRLHSAFVWHGSSSGLGDPEAADWVETRSGRYGYSVATAGDVDGDGYSEVIVGAPNYDAAHTDEGAAFVHEGSASGLSHSADWSRVGGQAGAYYGGSVFTAGDVNGDGYSDVIVGAEGYDNGDVNEGMAFVYLGSSSGLLLDAHWTQDSDQPGARYGYKVATAGDVNGDGYSEVIVGAPWYGTAHGAAYVYHGSAAGFASYATWYAHSNQVDARLGTSVSTAGDVNRDGYGDVIVGVPNYDNGEVDEGRIYLYFGNQNGVNTNWSNYREGNQEGAKLGDAVASAGDINGDGHGDVIAGAPGYDYPEASEGLVFVYLGHPTGMSFHWRGQSNVEYAGMGDAVGSAGDVNGDGFGDIIVGAPGYDGPTNAEGAAFVWLGSPSGLGAHGTPTNADWSTESNQEFGNMGSSVASAGDVNGDGYSDVAVGCIYYSGGQDAEGGVFVWHGSPTGLGEDGHPGNADWHAEWNQEDAHLGRSVASAGDVNGDGYSDLIVGGSGWDNDSPVANSAGRVSVYRGTANGLLATPSYTRECTEEGEYCGFSVAGLGDINGDGYSDVAFGAPYYDGAFSGEGRVVVLLGSVAGINNQTSVTLRSNQAGAQMGKSVASAGDVNADGYADMIVGAPYYNDGQTNEGRAYVFLGNEGRARTVLPQQRNAAYIPIERLGRSDISDAFTITVRGHGLLGRGLVRMEREIRRLDQPLDATELRLPAEYFDTGTGWADIDFTQDRLDPNWMHHWRVRIGQHPSTSPYQLWGRWITEPWGGYGEGQFRLWFDGDGDGFDDRGDNCPDDPNPGQEDAEQDGVGDICDNCPSDENPEQGDADEDGLGDVCDTCTDTDGDDHGDPGYPANECPLDNCPSVANPGQEDTDSDSVGDACDTCTDTDGDGYGNPGYPVNTCPDDNCPDIPNPGQENNDGDPMGDACDPDDDNDTIPDESDNCPFVENPGQENNDGDPMGDACDPDDDNDTIPDESDNCPFVENPGQENNDGDAEGDACDPDDDNDGWPDASDCSPFEEVVWAVPSDPRDLRLDKSPTGNLGWDPPADTGTSGAVLYDVLLSTNPAGWGYDFANCVESDDTDLLATESSLPFTGNVYYYLVRSENPCGDNMGTDSEDTPRSGRQCP